GLLDGQARSDGCGHGLLHQKDFAGPGAVGGVLHRAFFHRRDLAGHSDDDAGMDQQAPVVGLLDEIGEHLLGGRRIIKNTILHGLDGHHVAGRAPQHFLGFAPHGHHFPGVLVDGHDGGLVHHDALAAGVHQRVRRPQIDGQIRGKQAEQRPHSISVLAHPPSLAGPVCDTDSRPCFCRFFAHHPLSGNRRKLTLYGTTIEIGNVFVPPRRFCPTSTIVWLPRAMGGVKYTKCPSLSICATAWPLTISAAPGSVCPRISTTAPCNCVLSTSSSIPCVLPCSARVNLKMSLGSLARFCASVATTPQK